MTTGNPDFQPLPPTGRDGSAGRPRVSIRATALAATATFMIGATMTIAPATASPIAASPIAAESPDIAESPAAAAPTTSPLVGSADVPVAIPPELLPPSLDVAQAPPADPMGAGVIVADYLGDAVGRDALLAQLPGQHRAAVAAVLGTIHDPVATPDYANPSTHLTILGGGVLADGTLPAKVVQRMETGLAEANAHPSVPVLVTGGDTGNGVTEASSMRRWLLDNGVAAPETPAGPDTEEQRRDVYRDALLWHLLPESVIVDGVPPIAGPGIARIW